MREIDSPYAMRAIFIGNPWRLRNRKVHSALLCARTKKNTKSALYVSVLTGIGGGSGEIESAHRYIIQSRLKIAGAWWKLENACKMLALRVLRRNSGWENYWSHQKVA